MSGAQEQEAKYVSFPEHQEDQSCYFFQVGRSGGTDRAIVTRISISADMPGLNGNMERVRVWAGETLVAEAPLHAVEVVGYT